MTHQLSAPLNESRDRTSTFRTSTLPLVLGALVATLSACADGTSTSPNAPAFSSTGIEASATYGEDGDAAEFERDDLLRPSVARDRRGDFLSTYTGPLNGDLDARRQEVVYRNERFIFRARLDARIGRTKGAVYVWGVDRGQGTARFSSIGITGVLFDWVLLVDPAGASRAIDLITGVSTPVDARAVTVDGDRLVVRVPASVLPSRGFAPGAYTSSFWPRFGLGNNNQISDFAPDNSNVPVRVVLPE